MLQTQHPRSPSETMPTMYDLPSEDPEEPGLPDEFHDFQPKLLRETCQPPTYPINEVFIGTDINLYYDGQHPKWYKRPDWFVALGVSVKTQQSDLRWSYVVWQESVSPFLVVELLSPGTEDDDLGRTVREIGKPPTKWEVYERILRVPFYVVYDRYENQLRVFALQGDRYQTMDLATLGQRIWFEALGLGLGVWQGTQNQAEGRWLRWYDAEGNWVPSEVEARQIAEMARRSAEAARQTAEAEAEIERSARQTAEAQAEIERSARQTAEAQAENERSARRAAIPRLKSLGLTPEQIAEALGLSIADLD
jgi:Uma2 family endonuclease